VQGRASEPFDLVTPDKNTSRSEVEGWITFDQAKALFTQPPPRNARQGGDRGGARAARHRSGATTGAHRGRPPLSGAPAAER